MDNNLKEVRMDMPYILGIFFMLIFSLLILNSIAKFLFPLYFLYIILGLIAFFIFSKLDFEVISIFSKHLYIFSILFLILPLFIGQVSRGALRWIPIGALTIQPAELVRPFLLIFFANYLTKEQLNYKILIKSIILLLIPAFLILVQPALGMTVLMAVGFLGIVISAGLNKKKLLVGFFILIMLTPLLFKVLAPYQQDRIRAFFDPSSDPLKSGYNSIQSMISVGSGKFFGRGLGKGVQTQLSFLPEKHTDFIFASTAEELGFMGAFLLLFGIFFILWRLTKFMDAPINPAGRAFLAGVVITFLIQTVVNVGMNLGLLPITGLPLPLISAGGSSLLATMITLGIALGATKYTKS
ncbi:MAG TPA: FtsW/RodA/SpoVE family cell cycle protein [Patescibacteria group bacterium]|nr:FtsW/RodA/SpoVE family cell cycle protein [Patescibacteria group bacterium]